MNVASQPIVLPTTHRRRFLTTYKPTFIDASPIAVSNKIKAIQARRTRLNPLSNDTNHTDIRTLNFGCTNSKVDDTTVWTAERLVDRSKDIRLDRIYTRQPPRPSNVSTTSIHHSVCWANYQSSNLGNKQLQTNSNSTTITPPMFGSIKNKSPGGKISEVIQRRNRQPLIDRQNSLPPIEKHHQQQQQQQKPHSISQTIHDNLLIADIEDAEEDEEEEDLLIDKEFQQYLDKAIVKCADWLLKYVFKEQNNC